MSGNPPAGYYADPSIPGYIRYWDGNAWVPGTSRPAPDETGGGEPAGSGQGAAGGQGVEAVQDAIADARANSSGGADAWRPEPVLDASQGSQSASRQAVQQVTQQSVPPQQAVERPAAQQYAQQPVVQQQVVERPAVQQYAQQQAIPEQFQQQYARQQAVPAQFQQQYAPQQYEAQPLAQPAAAPTPQFQPQVPQQYQPESPQPFQPASQGPYPVGGLEPQRPETVAGMVVPSAFARNPAGGYAFAGAGNPFAGLPGSLNGAPDGPDSAGETTVLELATPGSRFLARIIDLGLAVVFSAPITVSLLLIAHRHDHQYVLNLDAQATTTYTTLGMDATGIALWGAAAAALVLVAIVYEGYRLGRGGQTAGKRLAGIRVVHLSDAHPLRGGGLGLRRALLFWVLAVLPLIDLLALGGVLWGRPYRQGLHERATSTATVKA
jgi:hypothetical protein